MPDSIPGGVAGGLPPARIDPRGHRFGAGLSALLIVTSFLLDLPLRGFLAFASIAVGRACLAWRLDLWRHLASGSRFARLGKVEPEHEYPPQFAQVFGSVVLAISLLASRSACPSWAGSWPVPWRPSRRCLPLTRLCLGCRLSLLRWWVPGLVTRFWRRGLVEPRTPETRF